MSSALVDAALEYATDGLPVLPLHNVEDGRCSCGKATCDNVAKHPRIRNGLNGASSDVAVVAEWWRRWPKANIGIRTGAVSGLIVLDVDDYRGGGATLKQLTEAVPRTPEALTGGGGRHFLFLHPGHEIGNSINLGAGLDLRADGGYIVAPPSVHLSGNQYKWTRPLGKVELAPCPDWLTGLNGARPARNAAPVGDVIPQGERDKTLASLAGTMRKRGMGAAEILAALKVTNKERCDPPLAERDLERIALSIGRYPPSTTTRPDASSVEPEPASEPRTHSWQPVNLAELPETDAGRPELAGLAYPDTLHLWSGEPETLKTLVAYVLALIVLRDGGTVLLVDFEMGDKRARRCFRDLGATDIDLERLLYVAPSERLTDPSILADVAALIAATRPALVIVDSLTPALELHDCDDRKGSDIERFTRTVIGPLRAQGAAIVELDHLVKDKERRGKFSIGSERKVGVARVHLGFEVIKPLSRGHDGLVRLTTHKDTAGFLARPRAAEIQFHSDPATGTLTWDIRPAEQHDDDAPAFRPTALMEKVSRYLELQHEPVPRNSVETSVKGRREYVRLAMDTLVREGYAEESRGSNNARLIGSLQGFRDDRFAPGSPNPDAPGSPTRFAPEESLNHAA